MFIVYLLDVNLHLFQIREKGKAGRGSIFPAFLWDIGKQLEETIKQTMT